MKIALHNFLTTLRRYKVSSLLNIVGLTMAFTAFYVILVQVRWELTFNRAIPDAGRIYLVAPLSPFDETGYSINSPRPEGEQLIARSPEIEAGGCIRPWRWERPVWVRRGGDLLRLQASFNEASAGFVEALGLKTVEGDLKALAQPHSVALACSQAERLGLRVGDVLWFGDEENQRPEEQKEVVALYEDFPANSSFAHIVGLQDVGDQDLDAPNNWNDCYFVRLHKGADPETVARLWSDLHLSINRDYLERMAPIWGEEISEEELNDERACRLIPLDKLYFDRQIDPISDAFPIGSTTLTYSLLSVAVLVILIALINFVNFFFALVPVRLRSVNILKVFGAPTRSLRFSFLFEAFGFMLLAQLCAWYVAIALKGTEFASYVSSSLALGDNLPVLGISLVVSFAAALIAGSFPAWYITSFNPAMAAKGSFVGSAAGRRFRTALLGVQFIVAIGLIVFSVCTLLQQRYVRRFDLGFDHEQVLTFYFPSSKLTDPDSFDTFASSLQVDPQIAGITASGNRFVAESISVFGRKINDEEIGIHVRFVRSNFLDVLGIPVLAGEAFKPEHDRDSTARFIVNDLLARKGLKVGDRLDPGVVIGICPDIHYRPLQYPTEPFAFVTGTCWQTRMSRFYVRLAAGFDLDAVCEGIREKARTFDPGSEVSDFRFFDEEINVQYARERRIATIVGLFTVLAVVIALMGVFGIVLFETQHRRREVAIRKVMGATTAEVLRLFNRRYVVLVAVCFLLAAPAGYWIVDRWLASFAYRTPIRWWVFAAAFAVVLLVTAATVTFCSWRTANENPADCVKSE
ncbi:FtsX-like permease family protein [uncultured Alistipes sp.]|uniref:FtsX-like permease family protein n=1 Tax=uncultured Alistipes sp. TaxID=538949 RepID=UPI00260D2094|nr:FtsX-like permease family protein [uncultured Alistipes sp.]